MNKIRNTEMLNAEISRLKDLSGYQLEQMKHDLKDIREDLNPVRLFKRIAGLFKSFVHKEHN